MPPRPADARPRTAALAALAALAIVATGGATTGCKSAAQRRVDADRAAYRALAARRAEVPEIRGSLDLDAADAVALPARRLRSVDLDLDEALRLAAAASRDYRERREQAYRAALSLATERQRFRAQGGLGGAADARNDGDGTAVSAGPTGSLSKAFETGGSVVVRLAASFVRAFSGDPVGAASLLTADLVLPLARGAGEAARESLTQAERDVLYELRSFARFQQSLVVEVATGFYGVLQAKDVLANEELTYQSLLLVHERAKSFGPEGAGRLPDFEVDQARQDVLRADERRQQAQRSYEATLDGFKRTLGVPMTATLTLRADALEALRARGLDAREVSLAEALATALGRRLDLATARDRVDDARRKLDVAKNALGPDVKLALSGAVDTPARRPLALRDGTPRGSAGLDVDLPLERTAEGNAYRAAEIDLARARRDVEALEDDVTLAVRGATRSLAQARRSFDLQKEGVRLAARRVESAKLNLQAGKATIRDVLDAENALVEARNALTAALVDHAVARLELDRDDGVLDATILAHPAVPAAAPLADPTAAATGTPTDAAGGAPTPTSAAMPAPTPAIVAPVPPPPPATPSPATPPPPTIVPAPK